MLLSKVNVMLQECYVRIRKILQKFIFKKYKNYVIVYIEGDGFIKVHDFNESINRGKRGEEIILDILNSKNYIQNITDVSNDSSYFEKDIDFIVEFTNGNVQTVEIKTDFTKYPNFFYEEISALETNSIGCFEKTEAEILIYYFIELNLIYIFNMPKFRGWFHSNKQLFIKNGYRKSLKNKRYNGDLYTTVGYAFPRSLLEDKDWVNKIEYKKDQH